MRAKVEDHGPQIGEAIELPSQFGVMSLRHLAVRQREGVVVSGSDESYEKPLLLRLQSSCLFSESFTAGTCDCALQLHESLRRIVSGGGLLIYLYDEGRGAGLRNKISAIRLQQAKKINTAEAYTHLGLEADPRSFDEAVSVAKVLVPTDRPIHLLTNNPRKVQALNDAGYRSVTRAPLIIDDNPATQTYLRDKAQALGHLI